MTGMLARTSLLFLSALCLSVHGQDQTDFSTPLNLDPGPNQAFSANPIWTVGSTENIRFKSTLKNYTIKLWQQDLDEQGARAGPTIFSKTDDQDSVNEFDWLVQTYTFDTALSDVYFLWLSNSEVDGATTHYFNITDETKSSSSASSTQSASSKLSASPTPSATSTSSSKSSETAQAQSSANNDLSNGAKIGIGVGAAFGGIIMALLGALIVLIARRRRRGHPSLPQPPQMQDLSNRAYPPIQQGYASQSQPSELRDSQLRDSYSMLNTNSVKSGKDRKSDNSAVVEMG